MFLLVPLPPSAMKWKGSHPVIRQAISCDVCGTEMLSANHWFIAREHGADLRIGLWSGQSRLGPTTRHLCGHKCLHKFLDDFLARKSQVSSSANCEDATRKSPPQPVDIGVTSPAAFPVPRLPVIGSCAIDADSSARLLPSPPPFVERMPSRRLRAEAWKRELERERQQNSSCPRSRF